MGEEMLSMFKAIYPCKEVNGIFGDGNAGNAVIGFQIGEAIKKHAAAVSLLAKSIEHLQSTIRETFKKEDIDDGGHVVVAYTGETKGAEQLKCKHAKRPDSGYGPDVCGKN